jgi:hypothetical protein
MKSRRSRFFRPVRDAAPGRRTRWLPIVVLVMATAGLVAVALTPVLLYWIGNSLLVIAISLASITQLKGPLRPKHPLDSADEREEAWNRQASWAAFATVAIVAMIGIGALGLWLIGAVLLHWGQPTIPGIGRVLVSFALYLMVLLTTIPTLHASWSMPEIVEDEPEEEDRLSFLKPRRPRL